MLCSKCQSIYETALVFENLQTYKEKLSMHKEAGNEGCYMCDCIWRSFVRKYGEIAAPLDATQYGSTFRIFDRCYEESERFEMNVYCTAEEFETLGSFILEPVQDHETCNQPHGQAVSDSTDSDTSWKQAQLWLVNCQATHLRCNKTVQGDAKRLPSRLLDLRNASEDRIRLCSDPSTPCPDQAYMTLSHRWGQQPIRLINENFEYAKRQGFRISRLPRTFLDAVEVALHLGVRYLWIDALCIIQDSPEDWAREVMTMADVYRGAVCNISATGALDSDGGLFCHRREDLVKPQVVKAGKAWLEHPLCIPRRPGNGMEKIRGWFKLRSLDQWSDQVAQAPLMLRGWVLQERLLAPRVLHYSSQQLYWECGELDACETFPDGLPTNDGVLHYKGLDPVVDGAQRRDDMGPRQLTTNKYDAYYIWNNIITLYSQGNLTVESDKMVAIAGLAKYMQTILNDRYIAGLWERYLPSQLLWYCNGAPGTRARCYVAPSWSWASAQQQSQGSELTAGPVHERNIVAEIIEYNIESVDPSGMGHITSGFIRVRGPLYTVKYRGRLVGGESVPHIAVKFRGSSEDRYARVHPDAANEFVITDDADVAYHLLVIERGFDSPWHFERDASYLFGLVLQPTNEQKGQFRRLGFIYMYLNDRAGILEFERDSWLQYEEKAGDEYIVSII